MSALSLVSIFTPIKTILEFEIRVSTGKTAYLHAYKLGTNFTISKTKSIQSVKLYKQVDIYYFILSDTSLADCLTKFLHLKTWWIANESNCLILVLNDLTRLSQTF
jgi:hypothetical protein